MKVICMDNSIWETRITVGKIYDVLESEYAPERFYRVLNPDSGITPLTLSKMRFTQIAPTRAETKAQIISDILEDLYDES